MTEREFCIWLLGILEGSGIGPKTEDEIRTIHAQLRVTLDKAEIKSNYQRYTGH